MKSIKATKRKIAHVIFHTTKYMVDLKIVEENCSVSCPAGQQDGEYCPILISNYNNEERCQETTKEKLSVAEALLKIQ